MKYTFIILLISFLYVSDSFSQISKKNPAVIKTENEEKIMQSSNNVIINMPDRNNLKMLSKDEYQFNGKRKIINDDKIHWYALDNEYDSIYWKNVNCSKLIIEFKRNVNLESFLVKDFLSKNNLNKVISKSLYPELQNFYVFQINNGSKSIILDLIKKAKLLTEILYAEPEAIITSQACTPNDTYWNSQWGPYVMRADTVWCFTNRPSKNWTAVIDNAIAWSHPDLYNIAWYGYDFAMNDADPTPDYTGQDHGTHVSGTIGAERNNGVGIAGMSKDTLYFAKVQNSTNSSYDNTAISNALNTMSTINKIKVVNMSLRSLAPVQVMQTAINNFINNNKLVIAAAGNDTSSNPAYPAAWSNVISVASVGVNASGNLISASYSNYGTTIDVSAPGGESATGYYIISTLPNNTYGGPTWQGTSMAAPHVTGLAAMVWATNPFLSNTQVRTILEQQVYDLGTPGWDQFFGSGMCNAWGAFYTACMQLSINVTASGSTTFCNGNSLTLNAPYNENVNYQWRKDGININGATSNSLIATTTGNYSLFIQTIGCQTTSNTIPVTVNNSPSQAGSINGLTNVCANQNNVNYSIPLISNATTYNWTLPNGTSGSSNTNTISVNFNTNAANGNISVSGVNSCGVGPSSSLSVNFLPFPATPSISWNGSLFSTTATGVTYQWYLNGNAIAGANSNTYTPTSIGVYKVAVTANGCSSSSDNYTLVVTGIDPTLTSSQYSAQIYPNPAHNDFAIKFAETPDLTLDVQIINNLGVIVKSIKTKNKITSVKVNDLPTGIYFIKIIGGTYNQVRKIEVIK